MRKFILLIALIGCHAPVPQTPTPPPPDIVLPKKTEIDELLELVNNERAKLNIPKLTFNTKLNKIAQAYAELMSKTNKLSHTLNGNIGDRLTSANYNWNFCGENIAWNYQDPEDVMSGWMNSPGHRRNILNKNYKEIGIGIAQNTKGEIYWCQDFAQETILSPN